MRNLSRPDPVATTVERYTEALTRHAAAALETAKEAAAARARGDHIMAATLEAIHAQQAPVHPVVEFVALARRSYREAWKLRAGLIPDVVEGTDKRHYGGLKADARRHMQFARDLRFEMTVMPIELAKVA